MLGCVYVVTTDCYKDKSIFKIGFTTNLEKRLKTFNTTRMSNDLFYCVRQWRTVHYSKLEAFLHQYLKEFRRKNEFFEVDIQSIEEGAEKFARMHGPQFFYEDAVLINCEVYDVEYLELKKIFIFFDKDRRRVMYADETNMRDVVYKWLSHIDVYNLLKFTSLDVFDRLVMTLKQACASKASLKSRLDEDLSAYFRKMTLWDGP